MVPAPAEVYVGEQAGNAKPERCRGALEVVPTLTSQGAIV
jgi:hypothetical protein